MLIGRRPQCSLSDCAFALFVGSWIMLIAVQCTATVLFDTPSSASLNEGSLNVRMRRFYGFDYQFKKV